VHTPEGMPLPPNTLAELQRDMARLSFVACDGPGCLDRFRGGIS
jgi:hypothetical protein